MDKATMEKVERLKAWFNSAEHLAEVMAEQMTNLQIRIGQLEEKVAILRSELTNEVNGRLRLNNDVFLHDNRIANLEREKQTAKHGE